MGLSCPFCIFLAYLVRTFKFIEKEKKRKEKKIKVSFN